MLFLLNKKCHYAVKQVTTQNTGISNSSNKIISANNHLPVSLIFIFSVPALLPLSYFSYDLIHILIPLTLLISLLSVLFLLYLYNFLSAWPVTLITSELQKSDLKTLDQMLHSATTSTEKETRDPDQNAVHRHEHMTSGLQTHGHLCCWKFKDLCASFINNMGTKQKETLRTTALKTHPDRQIWRQSSTLLYFYLSKCYLNNEIQAL